MIPLGAALPMAAALVAATLFLRMHFYAGHEPLVIFFVIPIILSAYFGGVAAGLTATSLAYLASIYFLVPPLHSLTIDKPDDHLQCVALLVIGIAVSLAVEALHSLASRLTESRRLLAVTMGSIGDAVIVGDKRGRITFINAEAERMTGWTRAEAVGRRMANVFLIMDGETGQYVEGPADKVLRQGSAAESERRTVLMIAKDGRKIPIDMSAAPVRQEGGKAYGVVVVFRDFTERRKAEERANYLASFPKLNPSPVIEVNVSGEVTFSNAATSVILQDLGMDGGDYAAFLPDDLGTIFENWDKEHEATFLREVVLNKRVFEETIHLVPEFLVARIYAYDITGRK
jgi:PAS domain S-box-containing protein